MLRVTPLVLVLWCSASLAERPLTPPPPSPVGIAAYTTGALALYTATLLGTFYGSMAIDTPRFLATGKPEPLLSSLYVALSVGAQLVVGHWVVPQLSRLANDGPWLVQPDRAREEAWRVSRWSALAAGVGVVTYAVGAGLERERYLSGQGVMVAGALLTFAAVMLFDVLEMTLAWSAATDSRVRAPVTP